MPVTSKLSGCTALMRRRQPDCGNNLPASWAEREESQGVWWDISRTAGTCGRNSALVVLVSPVRGTGPHQRAEQDSWNARGCRKCKKHAEGERKCIKNGARYVRWGCGMAISAEFSA
jgi:hypothetical protein